MTVVYVVTSAPRHALSFDKEIFSHVVKALPIRVFELVGRAARD